MSMCERASLLLWGVGACVVALPCFCSAARIVKYFEPMLPDSDQHAENSTAVTAMEPSSTIYRGTHRSISCKLLNWWAVRSSRHIYHRRSCSTTAMYKIAVDKASEQTDATVPIAGSSLREDIWRERRILFTPARLSALNSYKVRTWTATIIVYAELRVPVGQTNNCCSPCSHLMVLIFPLAPYPSSRIV